LNKATTAITRASREIPREILLIRPALSSELDLIQRGALKRSAQEAHHRKITFEDEFIALLKKHKIPYDPKYVFG
jgi:hypothetical protein